MKDRRNSRFDSPDNQILGHRSGGSGRLKTPVPNRLLAGPHKTPRFDGLRMAPRDGDGGPAIFARLPADDFGEPIEELLPPPRRLEFAAGEIVSMLVDPLSCRRHLPELQPGGHQPRGRGRRIFRFRECQKFTSGSHRFEELTAVEEKSRRRGKCLPTGFGVTISRGDRQNLIEPSRGRACSNSLFASAPTSRSNCAWATAGRPAINSLAATFASR